VELDGRRLEAALPSRQGRLLFAYLALSSDRPVRRDELIDAIWPERPPADASGALNTLLSRLRRALGADVIVGKRELSLQLPRGAEIDVRVAVDALARAQAAGADRDWQSAWGPANSALAISQRGLLPGLTAPWLDQWRAEIEEIELKALELVAETGLGLGGSELAAAERGSRALIERAPFRESGYRLRMRLLAAQGNVAEALQTYEDLRQLLREHLGTRPAAELVTLHKTLLDGSLSMREAPSRVRELPPQAGNATIGTLFVGRVRELELLRRALTDAAGGQRRLALIGGEAGIGKTRLAEELTRAAAAEGWEVAWGRCLEGSGAPAFWPWVEVIRRLASTKPPERLRRALGSGAPDLARVVPELGELFPDLDPTGAADPAAARFRFFDAVDRFLVRLAAVTPLLLVFDDLHWADAPSLQLLHHVAARPDGAPVLLVGTYRNPPSVAAEPLAELLAALANEAAVRRVELGGLREDDLRALLANAADASDSLVAAMHRRTDGNPFFVTQLIGQLEGRLAEAEAEVVLGREIPGGVRDVIQRRVGRLPTLADELLTVAAVLGEHFELPPLAEVIDLEEERVLTLVEAAIDHGLVGESSERVGRYRFSHALIREALYEQLGALRRARLHRRVGEALERLYGDDTDRLVELAHHFHEAAAEGETERAHTYALRAAEQAIARLGYEQAEDQLRRGLQVLDRSRSDRQRTERELELQVALGSLLMMTRGYADPEVGAACARATELCRTGDVGTAEQLLGSLWRLGVYYEVRGDFSTSREIGVQLLELGAGSEQAPVFQIGGKQLVSVAALETGDPTAASEQLRDVRELADSLGDEPAEVFGMDFRVTSRSFLSWATTLLGNAEDGRLLSAEAVALARTRSRLHDVAFALFVEALCALLRRDADVARERADAAAALSAEQGFRLFGAMTTMIGGWAAAVAGDPDAGATRIANGLDAFEATGAGMMRHFFLALLAEAHQRAGRLEQALATVELGLQSLSTSGRFYEAELHRLNGELLLVRADDRNAEASFRAALAVASSQHARVLELRAAASLQRLGSDRLGVS
jgi:predicted ATPase/DNA-binding SARP family transcriptional activator